MTCTCGGGRRWGRLQFRSPQRMQLQTSLLCSDCPRKAAQAKVGGNARLRWPPPCGLSHLLCNLPSNEWGQERAACVREEGADAGLTRYPPYPNGATVRWPCLAEGPRCGREHGAGWSSSPPLHFQPWQPDWVCGPGGPAKTRCWGA